VPPHKYPFNTHEDAFWGFPSIPIVYDPTLNRKFSPVPSFRIAVTFEVPAGGGSGNLRVGKILNQVQWK
jgi:hypothetical protein